MKTIKQMWKYQGQSRENWRKMVFVDEYDTLFKHWRRLIRMVNDSDTDWRHYAKAEDVRAIPQMIY